MVFTTTKRPDLLVHVTKLGIRLRFRDGRYETDDPDEIRALRRHNYVQEGEPEQAEPAATDEGVSLSMTRKQLDELAEQAGVEHPDRLPNKEAVIDAIDQCQEAASA